MFVALAGATGGADADLIDHAALALLVARMGVLKPIEVSTVRGITDWSTGSFLSRISFFSDLQKKDIQRKMRFTLDKHRATEQKVKPR